MSLSEIITQEHINTLIEKIPKNSTKPLVLNYRQKLSAVIDSHSPADISYLGAPIHDKLMLEINELLSVNQK